MTALIRDTQVERIVREQAGEEVAVQAGPVWLNVTPHGVRLPENGWKIHVSSRASTFLSLVRTLLPVLLAEGCAFKLARSPDVVRELNDGASSPAAVGKAFTIYPDQRRIRELGHRLADLLAGHEGPRVLSDRRLSKSAPVYYRYGPFIATPASNHRGELQTWMRGPDAERFPAEATLSYCQPPWAHDPFGVVADERSPDQAGPVIVGGRYRIVAGIRESARGNVYRGIDRSGTTVVIKQGRALVDEDSDQRDTRLRLRNERRVLTVLEAVPGVPRFIDHFRHGDDEFLVISDCGQRSLAEEVLRRGAYSLAGEAGTRSLGHLAGQLARIILAVHARGVIMRDLAPSNVVIDGDRVSIVDFGLAEYGGLRLAGGTPGYAPACQLRNEPPVTADDLFGLGMTLLFAVTRLHPVVLGQDLDLPRLRALQAIGSGHGARPAGLLGAIADLLTGGEPAVRAVSRLAGNGAIASVRSAALLPSMPPVTADVLQAVTASLLGDLLSLAEIIVRAPADAPATYDASIYSGTSGLGLELLHHPHAAAIVPALAELSVRAARRIGLPPGLFSGSTGVDVFVHRARCCGIDIDQPAAAPPAPEFTPDGDDMMVGAAGVGLGHLYMYKSGGDPAHLGVARMCGATLLAGEGPLSSLHDDAAPEDAVELPASRAHGLAGILELLLGLAQEGDGEAAEAAAERALQLAERTRSLISRASDARSSPMAFSWCQGLAGIGQTLLHAGAVLDEPAFFDLAGQAADVCITHVPRLATLGQCCGAAGVGNFLIDVATLGQGRHYSDAAYDVAAHMLSRSGGSAERPVFVSAEPVDSAISWSLGATGILTFFRRLASGGGPDCIPV